MRTILFFFTIFFSIGPRSVQSIGQTIVTVAGTGIPGYSGDGGPATAARLDHPFSAIFDKHGNMFVADHYNHVVRKIDATGVITTVAGTGFGSGTFNGDYSGDGGPATNARMDKPICLAIDTAQDGVLYVGEYGNHVIRKIDQSGIITTIAGTGSQGYSGDGGPATLAQISDPIGMVFDSVGNLFFSNNGYRVVRKINKAGIISTIAGIGTPGFSGDGGPATAAQLRLTGTLAFNSAGELHIPDYFNYRVRKINSDGIIATVIGNGGSLYSGDGGPAVNAQVGQSHTVLFDQSGNAYIGDRASPRIRKVDTDGIITTVAGIGIVGYGGDGGDAIFATFNKDLNCSAIDKWGNLYVADQYNHRIRRINTGTNSVAELHDNGFGQINIFPNPGLETIEISCSKRCNHIQFHDALGRVVLAANKKQNTSSFTIDVSGLIAGTYFITTNTGDHGKFTKL